jgi:hypothetical protein
LTHYGDFASASSCPSPAGDFSNSPPAARDPLAARWLSGLLALQIKSSCWAAEDALGDPSTHSEREYRQPALGRTSHPWRTPQARQTTVAKYMAKHRRPPSQRWRTFLRNHADGIASMDLFVVPTISFQLLYGLLILQHGRRQILWLGVTAHPTADWIAQQ